MPQHSQGDRRLRVSALAAVANPSAHRLDTWHLSGDATQQLAAVDRGGLDTALEAARVRRLLDRLAAYEGLRHRSCRVQNGTGLPAAGPQ